jgi:hypothetical protein
MQSSHQASIPFMLTASCADGHFAIPTTPVLCSTCVVSATLDSNLKLMLLLITPAGASDDGSAE